MLTFEQITFYKESGYLLVPGVLSQPEAAFFRQESHNLIERLSAVKNVDATWGIAREMNTAAKLWHCHDVQFYSGAFSRLIVDERFTDLAAALLNSPNVQLHHNKLFIKPPEKGSPFPMHQDYPYFPHQNDKMLAAVFHFDDAPEEKGCIRVVPGSNRRGPLEHESQGGWHLPFERFPLEEAVACPAKAGDILFFNYLTVHGSGGNVSQEARTTLLVQLRDAANQPTLKVHDQSRGQGMMLRGAAPVPLPK